MATGEASPDRNVSMTTGEAGPDGNASLAMGNNQFVLTFTRVHATDSSKIAYHASVEDPIYVPLQ